MYLMEFVYSHELLRQTFKIFQIHGFTFILKELFKIKYHQTEQRYGQQGPPISHKTEHRKRCQNI